MKKLIAKLLVGIFSLGLCVNLSAEESKLYKFKDNNAGDSGTIVLEKDDVISIGTISNAGGKHLVVRIQIDDVSVDEWVSLPSSNGYQHTLRTYHGPLKISLRANGLSSGKFLYVKTRITRASEAHGRNVTGYSLVLPESTDTNYNLVLESSTDLVSWTADTTGTKTPSDKKRFYRLRAVKE